MDSKKSPRPLKAGAGISYVIKIQGHLEAHWSDWLGGLEITHDSRGYSLLTGVLDQAALHGILNQLRDLGLTLISITPQAVGDQKDGRNDEKSEH